MYAWHIAERFGINNLKKVKISEKPIKHNEVRVKIHACSLNYRDLMVVKGLYNPEQKLPLVPLSDGAGEVVEIGPDVTRFAVGDRVCATFSQKWCHGIASSLSMKNTLGSPLDGMLTESRVFLEDGLIHFPTYLTYEEAATLPCAAVTAFDAILYQSGLRPGDTVLLEGTGGVSLFALQFAKVFGLTSIITSSSDEKLLKAKKMSAHYGINYSKNHDWQSIVLDITNGEGVDAVVEVGGAKTINLAIRSVKKGGVICMIGILSGTKEAIDLRPILMNNIRIQGIFVGPKTVFEAMNRVLMQSAIHPVIDKVFNFDDVPNAFTYLESAAHFGKVCVSVA